MVLELPLHGDEPLASLCAEEYAEVRKIAEVLLQSELALEQLIFKLETAEMLGMSPT
jgi:division protein CdvB (Snf7/Vps24/ESCRT-III family)